MSRLASTKPARQPRADQSAGGAGDGEGQAVLPGREPELAQQHSQERFRRHDQPADEQVVEIERPQAAVAQDVLPAVQEFAGPGLAAAGPLRALLFALDGGEAQRRDGPGVWLPKWIDIN